MSKLLLSVVVLMACGMAMAAENTVVVPSDTKPFTVNQDNLVRISGKGIAGSSIEITIKGPAKVVATSNIVELVQGKVVIGNATKQFDVQPTRKGKVEVTVKIKPPQPDAKAVETKYVFEVK